MVYNAKSFSNGKTFGIIDHYGIRFGIIDHYGKTFGIIDHYGKFP